MKIVLLGCCGFIGSNILGRFIELGHNVIGIDKYSSTPHFRKKIIPPDFPITCGNILDTGIMEEHYIDADVILFAAGVPNPSSVSFDLLFDKELRTVVELLAFIIKKNPNVHFIFLSSGGTVYGSSQQGTLSKEEDNLDPISMYGVLKLACEKAIGLYRARNGLKATILRISNLYGIGQDPDGNQGFIPVILKKLLLNKEISIWGDGKIYRDFFYIDDFLDLMESVILSAESDGTYNVGAGRAHSLLEIIAIAAKITGVEPKINFLEPRPHDLKWSALSVCKASSRFNWSPRVSLPTGMKKMFTWLNELE